VQLTTYTDYALRTLMYLGMNSGRLVPVPEIASAYGISAHHVAKVAKALVRGGFVRAHRGRSGGLELAGRPADVTVGKVARYTEPTLDLLECFDRRTSTCPLTGACRLERTLHDARAAFLDVLDRTTLAELLSASPAMAARLGGDAAKPSPAFDRAAEQRRARRSRRP
jgi:Rrf2 family nitric oxide-sensitive transcriptional repressor